MISFIKEPKTQTETILYHLAEIGSITSLEAVIKYNIIDLQHAIYEIRNQGFEVLDKWEKNPKTNKSYKRYYMKGMDN